MASANLEMTYKQKLRDGLFVFLFIMQAKQEFPIYTKELSDMYLQHHKIQLPAGGRSVFMRRFRQSIRSIERVGLVTSKEKTNRCTTLEKRIHGFKF